MPGSDAGTCDDDAYTGGIVRTAAAFFVVGLALFGSAGLSEAKGGGGGKASGAHAKSTHESSGHSSTGEHHVKGHVTKDGTYVAPHKQTNPDASKSNNWSTKGNVNPYTGIPGMKDPYR